MKTSEELRNLLNRIDHKGYPAYKDTKGQYQFGTYVLSIDHVQGDPFASPSKVSVHIDGKQAGFDACLYDITFKRIALQDHLLRKIATNIREYSFKAKGSGKSGLISVTRPGQEILNRSACVIQPKNGDLVVRMEIGFPANGRTINARELEKDFIRFSAGMHQKDNVSKIIPERRVRAGGRSSHRSELYPGRTEKKEVWWHL